jgi:hypothetical protein
MRERPSYAPEVVPDWTAAVSRRLAGVRMPPLTLVGHLQTANGEWTAPHRDGCQDVRPGTGVAIANYHDWVRKWCAVRTARALLAVAVSGVWLLLMPSPAAATEPVASVAIT